MSGIYFLYDGSIHSDWVSHYAVRLAARHPEQRLHLIQVWDPRENAVPEEKTKHLQKACQRFEVDYQVHLPQLRGTLLQTICEVVPAGPGSFLVCGTRSQERKRGWLSGTLSEQLLRSGHCDVLVLRVVQPGLLGLPRQFLVPVSGHPRGLRSGLRFLRLFAEDVSHLHILHIKQVSRWSFRTLSQSVAERLRIPGEAYCERIEAELRDQLGLGAGQVDSQVVVSDDVPKEIVIAANKTKSRLMFLGASERNLTERLLFGNPIEQILRKTTCDVAIYRGSE